MLPYKAPCTVLAVCAMSMDLVIDWLVTFKDMTTDVNASSDLFPASIVTIAESFSIGLCGTLTQGGLALVLSP